MSRLSYRIWFSAAVAIIAAGIANPCVEFASNAGWLGHGDFTDHSNLDVGPTIAIGLALCALVILRRISELAYPGRDQRFQAWLRLSSHVLRMRNVSAFMPAAFGMQLLVLFAMESAEQVLVRGHMLGGTLWLGGPIIASVALHAFFCVATAYALSRALHGFARHAVRIARLINAALIAIGEAAPALLRATQASPNRKTLRHYGIGQRAPPSPSY